MRYLLCGLFALGLTVMLASDTSVHGQGKGQAKGIGRFVSEAARSGLQGRDLAEAIKAAKGVAAKKAPAK